MFSLVAGKLALAFCILIVGIVSVLAPVYVVDTNEGFFSVGNMMASGVLLAAGLIHQLADASETISHDASFPWAEFIAGTTFVFFLLLEESCHILLSVGHDEHNHNEEGGALTNNNKQENDEHNNDELSPILIKPSRSSSCQQQQEQQTTCNNNKNKNNKLLYASTSIDEYISSLHSDEHQHHHNHHHHHDHIIQHLHGSLLASIILLLALSIHSLLEGLAIGVAAEEDSVLSTTAAVLAHKAFAGYALGSSMVASEMQRFRHAILGSIFGVCSPLGILIGILVGSQGGDRATAVVKAMVAGTFLYVSIVEVGMKELTTCRTPGDCNKKIEVAKLVAYTIGFLAMSALALYV